MGASSEALKRGWEKRRGGETRREYLFRKSKKAASGCREWQGHTATTGYGEACYKSSSMSAHRMAYIEFKGVIPKGKIVRHKCDNAKCIEPRHLELGTKKDNRADFMKRHPQAKELCLKAAKIGAKGVKNFWDNMSKIEKKSFIKRRQITFNKKYPKGHPMYAARSSSLIKVWVFE